MEQPYSSLYKTSYALCIGINNYKEFNKLETCVSGAQRVAAFFRKQGYQVDTFVDDAATFAAIENWTNDISSKSQPDDRLFIYFAGHGLKRKTTSNKDEGYLALLDTKKNFNQALHIHSLINVFKFIKAKHIFLALDACFSGLALVRSAEEKSLPEGDIKVLVNSYTRRRTIEVLTAGGAQDFVYDHLAFGDSGLSPFTYFLLDGMNLPGLVTSYRLAQHIREKVQLHTEGQVPQFGPVPGSHSEGAFIFVIPAEDDSEDHKVLVEDQNSLVDSLPKKRTIEEIIAKIEQCHHDGWDFIESFVKRLEETISDYPEGSTRRVLKNKTLTDHLGIELDEDEHVAFVKILDSPYGVIELESFKPRAKLYFLRLQKLITRFPDDRIDARTKNRWQTRINGLLKDLGAIQDTELTLKRAEDFAKSALALTRFVNTSHDPELMAALYLIKMIDTTDRGGSQEVEKFLLNKIRNELELLVDAKSPYLFTDLLDDESNVWWAVLALLDHSPDSFRIHDYIGLTGAIQFIERLISRPRIVYPDYETARREVTFEIQTEQKAVLWITNLGFLLAQLLTLHGIEGYPERVREYVLRLHEPYIFGEKKRDDAHLFFRCLELEVWGRVLSWKEGLMKDHVGRVIYPEEFKPGVRLFGTRPG